MSTIAPTQPAVKSVQESADDDPYMLPLAGAQVTLATAGGKGASLARLAGAGLPVPGGFHITTAAYRRFVAANDLQPCILAALQSADPAQPATLEAAAQAIHDLFANAPMPPDIANAVAQAYAALPGEAPVVAVRSSATAEDLPDLSFAGQQETFLNVHGRDEVVAAVQRCWASLWTARAIGYRAQHAIDHGAVALAVVVQTLVNAGAAGILFTANPVTGARDQALINAAWGLGEAVVGGLVTPDTLTVDKAGGRVLARETADKQLMTVRLDLGTAEQPVPEARRRAPVLDDAQAAELVALGVRIEQLYGMPMDIEWALAEGRFAVLQARPITALPEPEVPSPTEWPLPHPKGSYSRTNIVELLPDPLTPLFGTLGLEAVNTGTRRLFEAIAGSGLWADDIAVKINDYAYMGLRLTGRQWWGIIVGALTILPGLFRRAAPRWRDEACPRYRAMIDHWQTRSLEDMPAPELLIGAREMVDGAVGIFTTLQSGILSLSGPLEALFTAFYDRRVKRAGDPPAATFLLGYDSAPILGEKALYDLALWCRERPSLTEHLMQAPARQLAAELESNQPPAGVQDWQEWQRRFRAHLQQYGHALYDLDFCKPTPADEPGPLLETCRMYVAGQGTSPYERQQGLVERREQATQAMLARLKGLRLRLFRKLLGWAQRWVALREDGLDSVGLGYPLARRMLRELGRRLVRAGAIECADDVYWLYAPEAIDAAAALEHGEPVPAMAGDVRKRKALWRAEKRVTPPPVLPPKARMMGIDVEKMGPVRTGTESGDTLAGVGASAGRATGIARVLHGPEEFGQMRPGEILVAAVTTPAWTPLFAMASAIVTDVGGPLSHGSIVAREYGIPAVLGTGVATRRIHSGDTITVDGDAGTVTLQKAGDSHGV